MGRKPVSHWCRGATGQQVDDAPPFQVADDGAVGLTAPPRPIIDADHARWWRGNDGTSTDQAQNRVAADRHRQSSRQTSTELAAEPHADVGLRLGQSFASTRFA